jgi:hypothetical protein
MPHTAVLGFFPYGPGADLGVDGQNEIDLEFSHWNDEEGVDNLPYNSDFGVYPPPGAGVHWEADFNYTTSLAKATTVRLMWSSKELVYTLWDSFVPLHQTFGYVKHIVYAPHDYKAQIPQQALPLVMNLWSYEALPPKSAQTVDIAIVDFSFFSTSG